MQNIKVFEPYGNKPFEAAETCKIVNKGNVQIVCMPDGTVLPKQVWSRVFTSVHEAPYVIVKMLVNIE